MKSLRTSPTAEDQIDRVCDLFEEDLKAGRRPDLTAILRQVPVGLQQSLLIELILVGLEYVGTSPHCGNNHEPTEGESRSDAREFTAQATTPDAKQAHATEPVHDASGGVSRPVSPTAIDGYELLEELGRGGMGIVYRARQINVDRLVALKIIKDSRFECLDDARRAVFMERFRTEAKAASRLDHENIATVFEIAQCGDQPYYTMRLVEGKSLDNLVQFGPLPADRAARYLLPIARAVDRLHSTGVVHRDLKPSNILIEEATDTPFVTDFGLAKLIDTDRQITLSNEGFGSPPYMAPEQVLNATSVTGAADIYSLGATLYHLLTGRPPFQTEALAEIARQIVFCDPTPPRQLNLSVPRDLETICLRCLEKDEHRRYARASDLADDLQRFLEHRPIIARPNGRMDRVWKWYRRNPAWVSLLVGFVALLSIMGVISGFMFIRERLATTVAERALVDNRLARSSGFLAKSLFVQGIHPNESLPWLLECLKLDEGSPREFATRQRIHSVLFHGLDFDRIYCHDRAIYAQR